MLRSRLQIAGCEREADPSAALRDDNVKSGGRVEALRAECCGSPGCVREVLRTSVEMTRVVAGRRKAVAQSAMPTLAAKSAAKMGHPGV